MSLKDKIAIVTGGASGIGQQIVVTLASRGAKVVTTDIRDNADETMEMVSEVGGTALYFKADLCKAEDHEAAFAYCEEQFGSPNIYVACGGLNGMIPMKDSTVEDLDRMFATNVRGNYLGFKQVEKSMKPGSKVIVISSSSMIYPTPGMTIYAATKAAIYAMVDVLAIEWGSLGITINTVHPGLTATKDAIKNIPEAHKQNVINATPLGRMGTPEDIAKTVAMMCTNDSDWLTGQHIVANGGANM